ncbi:MAG: hypothetical protein KDE00_12110 [Rhodobacteraceae bacterium]|nr:hypothetical protein [Paracoccaceae bacterium]
MNNKLESLFRPYFRTDANGDFVTADGRVLDSNSTAMEIADELFEADPSRYADEIIKLLKPFCRRFDIAKMRAALGGVSTGTRKVVAASGLNAKSVA